MDILKKIKEIDIAAGCNNRAFYENLICWMDENFSPDDDCSIYQFIKSTQNDCEGYISDYFSADNTLCYYPFRLRVLAEYDLMSEEEYCNDIWDLRDTAIEFDLSRDFSDRMVKIIYQSSSSFSKSYLRDKCLELWERKINVQNGHNQTSK